MMTQEFLFHHLLSNRYNLRIFLDRDLSGIEWMTFGINNLSASERRINNERKREKESQDPLAEFLIGKKEIDCRCIDVSALLRDGWIISVLTLPLKTHVLLLSNVH